MTKYPIGIQSFEKIRINDFVYVDKTALVYDLVSTSAVCFLTMIASGYLKTKEMEVYNAFPMTPTGL